MKTQSTTEGMHSIFYKYDEPYTGWYESWSYWDGERLHLTVKSRKCEIIIKNR